MKMFKSIFAIIAGFVTVFILSVVTDIIFEVLHIFPGVAHQELYVWWMLVVALLYRCIYAVIGGYVTAMIAPKNKMKHVLILAAIGFIFATLGLLANLDKGNVWYPILLVISTIPTVWLGGKLRLK